jgi:glycosyltransferase involved in cell wall biosynthesis
LTRGGRAKSSVDLATVLARLGYRSTILAHPRHAVPEPAAQQLTQAGVHVELLPRGLTGLRVLAALERLRPDVLVVHSEHAVAMLAPLKHRFGSPRFIFAKRGFWAPHGIWTRLMRRAGPQVDAVACVSHAVANFWTQAQPEWDRSRIHVVHDGIEPPGPLPPRTALRAELGLAPDTPLVGGIGRMVWAKGHRTLIEALPLIRDVVPDAHLILAGDGPYRATLQRVAEETGLVEHIHFLGWREDALAVLSALDVFVHPTLLERLPFKGNLELLGRVPLAPSLAGEALGRAVLEACAAGVPVVATDAGGHRDVITHGQTGLLVPLAEPEALAEAVTYLLTHPTEAQAMAAAAQHRVNLDFSLAALGDRYHHLIQRLLRGQ